MSRRLAIRDFPYVLGIDGTDGTVDFGDNFNKTQVEAFSVSYWMKVNSFGNFDRVLSKRNGGNEGWEMQFLTNGDKVRLFIEDQNNNSIARAASIKFGVWQHIVATKGTGLTETSITVYVDSVDLTVNSSAGTLDSTLENVVNLKLGSTNTGTGIPNIEICQVRIHDVELTQTQIDELYFDNKPEDVEAEWLMTDGSGTTLTATVGGVDGTITNEIWSSVTPFKPRTSASSRSDLKIQPYYIKTPTEGYATFGDVFDYERTQPFSSTGWYFVALSNAANQVFISKRDGANAGWEFLVHDFNDVTNKLQLDMKGANGTIIRVRSDVAFTLREQWVWMGMSYDGSSAGAGVKFYINGSLAATSTITDTLNDSILHNKPFNIGSKNDLTNNTIRGGWTDVRFHNAELSAQAMADVYNKKFFTSVVGEWDYTTGTGSTLTALIGGNDGTLVDATWDKDGPKLIRGSSSGRTSI